MKDSTSCNEAIVRLADWIAKAHKGEAVRLASMVVSFEARSIAADDLIGRYYSVMPEFTALCDELADGSNIRRSMVREALRCINDRVASTKAASGTGRMSQSSMRDLVTGVAA